MPGKRLGYFDRKLVDGRVHVVGGKVEELKTLVPV
jgi:hypothetical protein